MARFGYTLVQKQTGNWMPRLEMTLQLGHTSVEVSGLLDSGASINVLPYYVGVALGANWKDYEIPLTLAGNLGRYDARAIVIEVLHPQITGEGQVPLIFAWTEAEDVPLILGQTNFFSLMFVSFVQNWPLMCA